MYNTSTVLHLTIPSPSLPSDLMEVQRHFLGYVVSIEEVVTLVLFIEYFTLEYERDFIRHDYIDNLMHRFQQYDATLRASDTEFVNHLRRLGVQIPFNLELFAKGYRSPEMKSYIYRSRHRFQKHYLFLCENIERLYTAVATFYSTSSKYDRSLKELSAEFIGIVPKVTRNEDLSLNITLVRGSML